MVYLIDLIRGEKLDRYVARETKEITSLFKNEDPDNGQDFLLRVEKVEETEPIGVGA